MIAAVFAVVTSAQASPAERLVQFMNNAPQRGIAFTVASGPWSVDAKFSYQLPSHQYFEITNSKVRTRFMQAPERITLFDDTDQLYYEYKSYASLIGPPPDAGLIREVYPWFIFDWRKSEALKDATNDGTATLDGISVDWIKLVIKTETGNMTIRIAVSKDGSPKQVVVADPMSGPTTFTFNEFTWPFFDVKGWKYQPPVGYMVGTAPKMHRPKKYGEKIDFKSWDIDVAKLNKKGVAIIVTTAESKPDASSIAALTDIQKALDKLGVKTVEVHLDATSKPKRPWPVTLDPDGRIMGQLDVPVTPYIFFVNDENMILKAWAGYAEDQRTKLVKTAVDTFNPAEDEE